jgi:short-subunit dehydrogenase
VCFGKKCKPGLTGKDVLLKHGCVTVVLQMPTKNKRMKTAIVIGATSGIGKALASLLADADYLVAITGRREELLLKCQSERPESFIIKAIDITEMDTLQGKLNELKTELGSLDLLVLSSGTGDLNESLDFSIEKRTIDTNVSGFAFVAGWAFKIFEEQGFGHLVAITSIAGLRGSRQSPSYNATKAFQINYLEALRQKARKHKLPIRVTDIRPGLVDTDMAKGDGLFWVADVEKAAKQMFIAIEKKRRIVFVTKRWAVVALILKVLPSRIYEKM